MKKFTILLLSLTILTSSFSCKKVLLILERVKQPKLETHDSLSRFLQSYGIDTSEILSFKDITALNAFYLTDINLPDSRFFNRDKLLVDYRTSPQDCNGKVSIFIEKSDSVNLKAPVTGKNLDQFLNDIVIQKTGEKFLLEDQEYDVYLVIYWTKYLGKINKKKVFEWQELVKMANKNGKKIRMILISGDYQQFWNIPPNEIPRFNY